jgi:acetoin utilization deacetylase AcuC-like enzyme
MSSGFDAAAGDVGNCRNYAGLRCERGMDLSPEDFGWATTEVLKVADLCCGGKVVSVLEGGYGEYDSTGLGTKGAATRTQAPSTRHGTRNGTAPSVESPVTVITKCRSFRSFLTFRFSTAKCLE